MTCQATPRHTTNRHLAIGSALLLAFAFATGCEPPPPDGHDAPVTVRARLSAGPVSLSFVGKAGDSPSEIIAYQITDSLVQFNAKLELEPRLAESWERSDDKKTLTFRLRRGVRWHDGEPFDAEDVLYTVALVQEPATENRSFGPKLRGVTVRSPDPYTIVATYAEPEVDALEGWRVPIVPEHVAGLEARVENGTAGNLANSAFAANPVGCGPFRFVRHVPDSEVVLEANDGYWDGRPSIDRLVFKVFRDQQTAFHALLGGDLEITSLDNTLWKEALASGADHLDGFVYYVLSLWQVTWNADGSNPFFTDPRVRQAMVLALDRDEFSREVFDGLLKPGVTAIHPDSAWFDASLSPWPYDADRARALLDAAGWVDSDGDGIRDRDGRPFRFTLTTPASSVQIVDQMAAWQQQAWRDVGIDCELRRVEYQSLIKERNAHNFEAVAFRINTSSSPDDLFDLHHSDSRDGGWNFAGLDEPEIDRLLEAGRSTFDLEQRREIYRELQRRIHELEPITVLFHFPTPVVHDKRLQGVTPSPIDFWRNANGPRVWRWVPGEG